MKSCFARRTKTTEQTDVAHCADCDADYDADDTSDANVEQIQADNMSATTATKIISAGGVESDDDDDSGNDGTTTKTTNDDSADDATINEDNLVDAVREGYSRRDADDADGAAPAATTTATTTFWFSFTVIVPGT